MSLDLKALKQQKSQTGKPKEGSNSLIALFQKNYELNIFSGVGIKQKEKYYSEIGILLLAGVDLQTILKLSMEAVKPQSKLHKIYTQILVDVTQGKSLSKAMENTRQFDNFDCYSVLIGESTGELSSVFNKLSRYYNKQIIQKRKIVSSLSYPIIILFSTVGAIYFMLKFVVPMFADTLQKFGGELPPLTKFIITLSEHVSVFFYSVVILASILFLFRKQYQNKEVTKRYISLVILKIPYVGKLVLKIQMARFCQAMDLLLSAKVNIVESVMIIEKMIEFYPLRKSLAAIKGDLLKGAFFHKTMASQKIFDPQMIALVRIGEETNQLDRIFTHLTAQYENDIDYHSTILISIIEPVMILVLAVVVGLVLIAMYLPMFKIGTVIH